MYILSVLLPVHSFWLRWALLRRISQIVVFVSTYDQSKKLLQHISTVSTKKNVEVSKSKKHQPSVMQNQDLQNCVYLGPKLLCWGADHHFRCLWDWYLSNSSLRVPRFVHPWVTNHQSDGTFRRVPNLSAVRSVVGTWRNWRFNSGKLLEAWCLSHQKQGWSNYVKLIFHPQQVVENNCVDSTHWTVEAKTGPFKIGPAPPLPLEDGMGIWRPWGRRSQAPGCHQTRSNVE